MRRLRPLSEAECYARCYFGGEATVTVLRVRPQRPQRPQRAHRAPTVSGERVRRLFEERLDARTAQAA